MDFSPSTWTIIGFKWENSILYCRDFRRSGPMEIPAVIDAANCAIEEAARLRYKKLRMISAMLSKMVIKWLPTWKANNWCTMANLVNPFRMPQPIGSRDATVKLDDLLHINRQNNMVIEFQDNLPMFFNFGR